MALAQAEEPTPQPFFPFCIDWHDAKKRSFEQQAVMLKELGYEGVGHIYLEKVAERLQTLDDAGLKLFQITMGVEVGPDKQAYDARTLRGFLKAVYLIRINQSDAGSDYCAVVSRSTNYSSSIPPSATGSRQLYCCRHL